MYCLRLTAPHFYLLQLSQRRYSGFIAHLDIERCPVFFLALWHYVLSRYEALRYSPQQTNMLPIPGDRRHWYGVPIE